MGTQQAGETEKVQEERFIQIPDETAFARCQKVMGLYRVTELRQIQQQMIRIWNSYPLAEGKNKREQNLADGMRKLMKSRTSLYKVDLQYVTAFFVADERNVALFLDSLPSAEREMWRCVVIRYFAGKSLLLRETGQEWLTKKYYYSYDPQPAPLHWFYVYQKGDYQYNLALMQQVREYFYPYFLGRRRKAPGVKELPAGTAWHVFHAENELPGLLSVLEALYLKKELTAEPFDKMKWTTARKIGKQLKLREFFPDAAEKNAVSLRALLLTDSFAYCRWMAGKDLPVEQMAKQVLMEFTTSPEHLAHTLLPHVTGIRRSALDYELLTEQATHIVMGLDRVCRDGEWTGMDRLLVELYFLEEGSPANLLFLTPAFYNLHLFHAKLSKKEILIDEMYRQVGIPFVKGFLFLLAAWGILEIAYEDMDLQSPSYYDSVRYFRLTELGRYLLGRSPLYVPVVGPEVGFDLEEERLLFRSKHPDNPYEPLVDAIAEPVGAHRFRVSEASFLANCGSSEDLEKNIALFRQYVCACPPPVWEDFFHHLRSKSVPWEKVSPRKFEVYRVPQNVELLRLLSSDELLRQCVRRAEGYMVLVETHRLPEVRQRLKEFGFLL